MLHTALKLKILSIFEQKILSIFELSGHCIDIDNLIFLSGCGSTVLAAQEGKLVNIFNYVKI